MARRGAHAAREVWTLAQAASVLLIYLAAFAVASSLLSAVRPVLATSAKETAPSLPIPADSPPLAAAAATQNAARSTAATPGGTGSTDAAATAAAADTATPAVTPAEMTASSEAIGSKLVTIGERIRRLASSAVDAAADAATAAVAMAGAAVTRVGAAPSTSGGAHPQYDGTFQRYYDFYRGCPAVNCRRRGDGTAVIASDGWNVGGYVSKGNYQSGMFSVSMRLPPGYSGGVIPAFFLRSSKTTDKASPDYLEIDFEFIGARSPREITIHTNLFAAGRQHLVQYRFSFDPSAKFHQYGIVWNNDMIAWTIDNKPIRITRRSQESAWPRVPCIIEGSIWDSSSWSELKSNYTKTGPILVAMRNFRVLACPVYDLNRAPPKCATDRGPQWLWNRGFTAAQLSFYTWFGRTNLHKDYGWSQL